MTWRSVAPVVCALAVGLIGCGPDTPTPGVQVDVTGSLTDAAGKPMKDVNVTFHPTGGASQPVSLKVGPDGTFSGKVVAGKYSWFVAPQEAKAGSERLKTEALKGIPAAFLEPSLDRQLDVSAGAKLDLKVS